MDGRTPRSWPPRTTESVRRRRGVGGVAPRAARGNATGEARPRRGVEHAERRRGRRYARAYPPARHGMDGVTPWRWPMHAMAWTGERRGVCPCTPWRGRGNAMALAHARHGVDGGKPMASAHARHGVDGPTPRRRWGYAPRTRTYAMAWTTPSHGGGIRERVDDVQALRGKAGHRLLAAREGERHSQAGADGDGGLPRRVAKCPERRDDVNGHRVVRRQRADEVELGPHRERRHVVHEVEDVEEEVRADAVVRARP